MKNKYILLALLTTLYISTAISQKVPDMLIGEVVKEDFMKEPYISWFEVNYEEYEVDTSVLKKLKKDIKKTKITVFLGTWCGDTRREVPRFIRILDELNFDHKHVEFIALDRSKAAPGYKPQDFDVQYVPTFIFFKNGKECGRIIESPSESLEMDMANILKANRKKK